MVRFCAFPNCPNKMTSWTTFTFHRLPFGNVELLKLWLIALRMDPNSDVDGLKKTDHRVCSAHFKEEDFLPLAERVRKTARTDRARKRLRTNAIPVAEETSNLEESASGLTLPESEFETCLQSTPAKSQQREEQHHSGTILELTSPPQTTKSLTRRSLSGKYLALAPTWSYKVSEQEVEAEVSDLSMSIGDLELDPRDTSFKPHSSSSSTGTRSKSTSCSGEVTPGWTEKKWLVNESHLLQLFQNCPMCSNVITETVISSQGSKIRIHWTCGAHSGDWQSSPDLRGMAENNLLISAATFFTGSTYTDLSDWATFLNIPIPKSTQFYEIQKIYLLPAVQSVYQQKQENILAKLTEESLSGKRIELCGDGRCDSPGYSAKYSTYSFQNDATKEIVHFELVQVSEASSSVAMEVMGFQRGMNELLSRGVDVAVMTTDRSPSVRKLLKEEFPQIRHEFDPWHVVKGVKKKIVAAGKRKGNRDLLSWLKAITNHLYWSCESSKGDPLLCIQQWTSLLNHICGIHRWEEDGVVHTCHHAPLSEEEQERKRWLEPDSPSFKVLKEIVTDKNLLSDMKQMSLFKHTGSLENFHSVVLKYAPKRLHFRYDSMRARTQLAIMDHNENVGREQATTKEGQPLWSYPFSKMSQEWLARPVYTKTTQTFRKDLVERVLQMRNDRDVIFTTPAATKQTGRKRLLQNIAPVPRPDTNVLVERHTSRFGKFFRAKPY